MPDSISGCGPECLRDSDCPGELICKYQIQRCIPKPNPCDPSPCGHGTFCMVDSHGSAVCRLHIIASWLLHLHDFAFITIFHSSLHFTFIVPKYSSIPNFLNIFQGVSLVWFLSLTPSLVVDLNVSLILTVLETMFVNHKNVFLVQILVYQALVDLELDVLLDLLAIPSVGVNLDWFPTLTPSLVANLNVLEILIVLEEITSVKTKSKF